MPRDLVLIMVYNLPFLDIDSRFLQMIFVEKYVLFLSKDAYSVNFSNLFLFCLVYSLIEVFWNKIKKLYNFSTSSYFLPLISKIKILTKFPIKFSCDMDIFYSFIKQSYYNIIKYTYAQIFIKKLLIQKYEASCFMLFSIQIIIKYKNILDELKKIVLQ